MQYAKYNEEYNVSAIKFNACDGKDNQLLSPFNQNYESGNNCVYFASDDYWDGVEMVWVNYKESKMIFM